MDDIEKQLSDVLHDLAPEPPPFRFEPVDELGAGVRTRREGRPRRHRTFARPLLVAAAAAAVLGVGGAVAVVGGAGPSTRSGGAPVSRCDDWDDIDIHMTFPVENRNELLARLVLVSKTGHPCTLAEAPRVALEPDVASSTPSYRSFPVRPRGEFVISNLVLAVLDVRMSVEGTCQQSAERPLEEAAKHQPALLLAAPFGTYDPITLGLFGCRLTPTSVTLGTLP